MQVLKLGGSVLTKKTGEEEADRPSIRKLAKMLGRAWAGGRRDVVMVHGAGSFGHALVIKHGIKEGARAHEQKLAAAKVHAACARLSGLVTEALLAQGVAALPLPPAALVRSRAGRIERMDEERVLGALADGYMPVLHGDMVPDAEWGMSVCSGDQIVARLSTRAERLVLGTDVDGVMAEGRLVERITPQNFGSLRPHLGRSGAPDVTGGMAGKIEELLKARAPSYIVNARHPERVEALLAGKKAVCTEIRL